MRVTCMAQISTFLKKRLSESMNQAPLGDTEFRGIPGIGGHYFSRMSQNNGNNHLFSAEVDGQTVYVYKVPVA